MHWRKIPFLRWSFSSLALVGCSYSPEPIGITTHNEIVLANPTDFDSTQWPMGEYTLQSATLTGDILNLAVQCPGQSPSNFQLVAWSYWAESDPVQACALLSFNPDTVYSGSNVVTVAFNMAPMKNAWRMAYRRHSGVIRVLVRYLEQPRADLRYEF